MKFCIGIISYFPDAEEIRTERKRRFERLSRQIGEIFPKIDVMIVSQNWKDEVPVSDNEVLYNYDEPLTIIGARKRLREAFLQADYDYIILFDDDCILEGSKEDGDRYLSILEQNPNKYTNNRNMFKLTSISKAIYTAYGLPSIGVNDGTGIEDFAYFTILKNHCPEKEITDIEYGALKETSRWAGDKFSTWDRKNIRELFKRTQEYLKTGGQAMCPKE